MECLKCKEKMIIAKFNADVVGTVVYLSNKKKGIFESEKRSDVSCYVCPKCGYIEFKANKPEQLILN